MTADGLRFPYIWVPSLQVHPRTLGHPAIARRPRPGTWDPLAQSATVRTFTIATNEYRGGNNERTEYHPCVAWDRLAEITGQFLSKGQLVDVEGRLQTRQWDDDAGKRHWKTEVVVASLEMLSGRSKKEYAKEVQSAAEDPDAEPTANGAAAENDLEAVVAM
jgi:single-strand DNA-binding protein